MTIRTKFNRIITGVLLSVICGGAVAEEDNIVPPDSANEAGEVEPSTQQAQPEMVESKGTEADKLQLELAREISVGEQASELKVLADGFADLPPEAVKALLGRGEEPSRLQRTVEALQSGPDLLANIEFVEELKRLQHAVEALQPGPGLLANIEFVEELKRLQHAVEALQVGQQPKKPRCPETELTATNIAYIEVAKDNRSGRVVITFDGRSYSVTVGEYLDVQHSPFCKKYYEVVSIQYLTPSQVELRLRTKRGIRQLIKEI